MSAQRTDPSEAVRILEDLEAVRAVGIHWGVFRLTDEPREEPPERGGGALAISAQTVNYNYSGHITQWDAPAIAAMNPGSTLPHQRIVPIRRADESGDSFIFTQFLDFSNQEWEDQVGYGTGVKWPTVAGEQLAKGNAQMVQTLAATPYSIAYVGISFHDSIARAGLGTARLENQSGRFLLPTPETVSAAASMLDSRTPPDERLSLVFAPGAQSYPLINYEYVVVSRRQADGATAAALRGFLLWAISLEGGNAGKYLDGVGFIALPDFIRGMSEHQIGLIGPGTVPAR